MGQLEAEISQHSAQLMVSVYLGSCSGVGVGGGGGGEGLGEVVVEGAEAMEDQEVIGMVETDPCGKVTLNGPWLQGREGERERSHEPTHRRVCID